MSESRYLSDRGRAALRRALDHAEHAMTYESARGAFAAFATMPERLAPSCWFDLVLGSTSFESFDERREVIDKLMQLCCEVMDHMGHATHAVCANADNAEAVRDWAFGYLCVVAFDDSFEDAFTSSALVALHILVKPELAPEVDNEKLRTLRVELPDLVTALYLYFRPARRASALRDRGPLERSVPIQAAARAGRNDPCPCGSGKRFGRCCAV